MNTSPPKTFSRNIEICERPVFVIGCPRSGTSVVAWSLAAIEEEFWTFPETDFFYYLFRHDPSLRVWSETHVRPDHRSWLVEMGIQQREWDEHVGMGLNALITSRAGGRRWIDQTPTYTLIAEVLARMYPDASFVNVLRDGRRVVHSMLNFMRGKSEEFRTGFHDLTWASDFAEACKTWALYATRGAAMCAAYPDRTATLLNEEMMTDPDRAFGRVLEQIGTSPSPLPASFSRGERINASIGAGGMNPWDAWTPSERKIFIDTARFVLAAYPGDVLLRVRELWPDFDAWYAAPFEPEQEVEPGAP